MKLFILLLLPVFASAQIVTGEIKCAVREQNGTHYDIHLQPDSAGAFHFKRCEPGFNSGLACVVYADSVCNVTVLKLKLGLQLTGVCSHSDSGVAYEYSFSPWDSDPLQHSISQTSSKAPIPQFFGTDYYCQKLK